MNQTQFDGQDTIVALSSAPGPGARAIVRLTGPQAWALLKQLFHPDSHLPATIERGRWLGVLSMPELASPLAAQVLAWAAPRSYTGQDLIEIHTLGSPPLVELLLAHLMRLGARSAQPGEFTMRAFLAGKLDLTQAEAVLGVIEAAGPAELKSALGQLAGGMARPLQVLRENLLTVLAEVEAGLDFAEEDLQFIDRTELLSRLGDAHRVLLSLKEQLAQRGVSGRPFRVILAGLPNAGKSSLFNALVGRPIALVSPEPGTTRDYLSQRLSIAGIEIELIDTAGAEELAGGTSESIAGQAQQARREQGEQADLVLLCHDASRPADRPAHDSARPSLPIWTKCDLADALPISASWLRTSAASGQGLAELVEQLAEHARRSQRPCALAPSSSRCRQHIEIGLDHLEQVQRIVDQGEPAELLALELRLALDQVGEMVGAVYTDDVLDRIFSQFCIGK